MTLSEQRELENGVGREQGAGQSNGERKL